jgi:hypothetical protein
MRIRPRGEGEDGNILVGEKREDERGKQRSVSGYKLELRDEMTGSDFYAKVGPRPCRRHGV